MSKSNDEGLFLLRCTGVLGEDLATGLGTNLAAGVIVSSQLPSSQQLWLSLMEGAELGRSLTCVGDGRARVSTS